MIPVLIGQIGAGKTEVGRRLAALRGARFLSIDELRQQGQDTSGPAIAAVLTKLAAAGVIFECTGAAVDFEDLLAGLAAADENPFVVLLECPIETAMRRIRDRAGWTAPHYGGSWAPQLRWTELRLRLVPADLCLSASRARPDELVERVARAWDRAERESSHSTRLPPLKGSFSYSQLATYEVCPLAYRYKYLERRPETLETEAMFLGKRLHEAMFYLYHDGGPGTVREPMVQAFLAARIAETFPATAPTHQRQVLSNRGSEILHRHYSQVYCSEGAATQALEHVIAIQLSAGLKYTGIIDRIAVAPSGVYEVIDYKSSARKHTSRPRVPDLLQVAAYGAAVMLEYHVPTALAYRLLLPTSEREELVIQQEDLPRIRHALRRWFARCAQSPHYEANPGRHCASCEFNRSCPAATYPPDAASLPADTR